MEAGKVKFVVYEENVFGYVHPQRPDELNILATSPLRGAVASWLDGLILQPDVFAHNVRAATRQDFAEFRIGYEQYAAHPDEYELPEPAADLLRPLPPRRPVRIRNELACARLYMRYLRAGLTHSQACGRMREIYGRRDWMFMPNARSWWKALGVDIWAKC